MHWPRVHQPLFPLFSILDDIVPLLLLFKVSPQHNLYIRVPSGGLVCVSKPPSLQPPPMLNLQKHEMGPKKGIACMQGLKLVSYPPHHLHACQCILYAFQYIFCTFQCTPLHLQMLNIQTLPSITSSKQQKELMPSTTKTLQFVGRSPHLDVVEYFFHLLVLVIEHFTFVWLSGLPIR